MRLTSVPALADIISSASHFCLRSSTAQFHYTLHLFAVYTTTFSHFTHFYTLHPFTLHFIIFSAHSVPPFFHSAPYWFSSSCNPIFSSESVPVHCGLLQFSPSRYSSSSHAVQIYFPLLSSPAHFSSSVSSFLPEPNFSSRQCQFSKVPAHIQFQFVLGYSSVSVQCSFFSSFQRSAGLSQLQRSTVLPQLRAVSSSTTRLQISSS